MKKMTAVLTVAVLIAVGIGIGVKLNYGNCHDNARCESMWAGMKPELLYNRYDTEKMTTDELKTLVWRYFISYWNNRKICLINERLPPCSRGRDIINFWRLRFKRLYLYKKVSTNIDNISLIT